MMKHITLARKYRPQSLSDIVGQNVLVQTIRNALALQKLPQAILLTGTRGIGKTTTARIIAKYLNCEQVINLKQTECCNQCESCIAIANANYPDVLEFDAASKTSVNDIREILETMQYRPLKSQYKFYIIDEVHMLSNSAFNALLKTLEEPPSHVRFIFATTEEQKIPLTVVSRCLQFRLKPISSQVIARRCNEVLKSEGYTANDAITKIIANAAEGSMRDALSILEGAIVFCADEKKSLCETKAIEMLGHQHHGAIKELFEMLCEGNIQSCLQTVRELYDDGVSVITMTSDILNVVHEMTTQEIFSQQKTVNMPFLLRAWHVLSETLIRMKSSNDHFIQLEMSLVKLAHLDVNESSNNDTEILTCDRQTTPQTSQTAMSALIGKLSEEMPSIQKIRLLNPNNSIFMMQTKIQTLNHLRVLLAFLLDVGEAILYHRLSSVVKVIELNVETQTMVIDGKKNSDMVQQIRLNLNRITNVPWNISVMNDENAMTYSNFLSALDKHHEEALLQTDIVQYILTKFDNLKVGKTKLNHTLH